MMSCRHGVLLLALLCVVPVVASDEPKAGPDGAEPLIPTPLRTVDSVQFSQAEHIVWQGAPQCSDGEVLLLLVPDQRVDGEIPPIYQLPSEVTGISADGREKTYYRPRTIPGFADADVVATRAMAVDSSGNLLLLVWFQDGEERYFYVVSFRRDGRYLSKVQIDPAAIVIRQFEVFDSGEFLFVGRRPQWVAERAVVMPSGGGALRDVVGLATDPGDDPIGDRSFSFNHLARAGDGRVYFVRHEEQSVYAINSSGDAEYAFELVPMPGDPRLMDLMASGSRLALTYQDLGEASIRTWIAVYDLALGELAAVYESASGGPVCYEYDRKDRFTFVRDANKLVTESP